MFLRDAAATRAVEYHVARPRRHVRPVARRRGARCTCAPWIVRGGARRVMIDVGTDARRNRRRTHYTSSTRRGQTVHCARGHGTLSSHGAIIVIVYTRCATIIEKPSLLLSLHYARETTGHCSVYLHVHAARVCVEQVLSVAKSAHPVPGASHVVDNRQVVR